MIVPDLESTTSSPCLTPERTPSLEPYCSRRKARVALPSFATAESDESIDRMLSTASVSGGTVGSPRPIAGQSMPDADGSSLLPPMSPTSTHG